MAARLVAAVLCCVLLTGTAHAQIGSERYSSMVVEARSGRLISAVNPDELRYPASLTKMMTLYMVFEALRDRRISLHQSVHMSATAAAMPPTKLGIPPGSRLTVEEAILALITRSANDAAAALGEMLGGDEERFARIMTLRARALGMSRTVFRNASGLPDVRQVTTARDMALLGRRLLHDFPREYSYFSTTTFRFRGKVFRNHNYLLDAYPGADGMKTGYINASGFNLVTSALRANVRLVGVVIGASRGGERDLHMMALLDQGFDKMEVPLATREARSRMPTLISSAQAAPAPAPVRTHTILATRAKASAPTERAQPTGGAWAVQVGAFTTSQAAHKAAAAAGRIAPAGTTHVAAVTVKNKRTFRAQLISLSQTQATAACAALKRARSACMPIRPSSGAVARR